MKKLLISTAIVGAVAFAPVANAGDLQVNVGGFLDFQAGYTSDDVVDEPASTAGARNGVNQFNFGTETEINFTVNGKADNGLEYGAVIELEADVGQADSDGNGTQADKAYLFAQGGWGRLEAGNNTNAAEALSVNTSTFASATGGVDGDWYRFTIAPTTPPTGTAFLVAPDLALQGAGSGGNVSGPNADEDATKITYYSPRVAGFQAGVSYAPNSDDVGTLPNLSQAGYRDVFTGGVNYSGEFSGVGIKAAFTTEHGSEKQRQNAQALNTWDLGLNLSYAGFTLGGSYADFRDTYGDGFDTNLWDVGLGYASGPYSASVTYLSSSNENAANAKAKFDNLVIGADYKLAPGLVPYAEVSFFDYNDDSANVIGVDDNSGTVVILGSQLTF